LTKPFQLQRAGTVGNRGNGGLAGIWSLQLHHPSDTTGTVITIEGGMANAGSLI